MFNRLAIFGVGLIGGSFALALKRARVVKKIVGFGPERESLQDALALGIVDEIGGVGESAAGSVANSDLILIAAPVAQTGPILRSIAPHLASSTIVTDTGSTKCDVIAAARATLGDKLAQFVPGHPIAGREVHGPKAALADLFDRKRVVLTPLPENSIDDVAAVRRAWEACGGRVDTLSPFQHDDVFATVSHLPHLLSYALVAQIASAEDAELKFAYAGAGFRDFTRIAASSPEMWRDIAMGNRDALLDDLDAYRARLDALRAWIAAGDRDAIEAMFETASAARGDWERQRQEAP